MKKSLSCYVYCSTVICQIFHQPGNFAWKMHVVSKTIWTWMLITADRHYIIDNIFSITAGIELWSQRWTTHREHIHRHFTRNAGMYGMFVCRYVWNVKWSELWFEDNCNTQLMFGFALICWMLVNSIIIFALQMDFSFNYLLPAYKVKRDAITISYHPIIQNK